MRILLRWCFRLPHKAATTGLKTCSKSQFVRSVISSTNLLASVFTSGQPSFNKAPMDVATKEALADTLFGFWEVSSERVVTIFRLISSAF